MNAPLIREFRLSPRGRGVACDASGAFIDSIPLLKRTPENGRDVWMPRDTGELSADLGAHYGLPIDVSSKAAGLQAIARALNAGNITHAQLVTLHLQIPETPPLEKTSADSNAISKFVRDLRLSGLLKFVWVPEEHPRWPEGTPVGRGGKFAPKADGEAVAIQVADRTPRINPATIRRAWERAEGRIWPKDPVTGRNYDVSHIKALADGGTNELDNIEPKPHDEHVEHHKAQGDFSRWAQRRGQGGSSARPSDNPPKGPTDSPPQKPQARPQKSPASRTSSPGNSAKPNSGSVRAPRVSGDPTPEEAAAVEELTEDEVMEDAVIEAFIPE